jgi:alpha-1,6-mannosyltransferase
MAMLPLLTVLLCAALIELGWLAMWPLSASLSHSPLFTSELLQTHPSVQQLLDLTLRGAHRVLPQLTATPIADPLGSASYAAPAAALAAVMLWLAATYALALIILGRWGSASRLWLFVVVVGALVFQATLAWLPGVFSQDTFSYIAYGRVAALYDLNPYIWPPSVLRDPVVPWVAEVWRTYPNPYGPVWVGVQWALARISGGLSISDEALVYRFFANVLLLTNLGLALQLSGRITRLNAGQRTTALAALAWNPLLLFETAANAHNDVLMVTFSLLALLVFGSRSRGFLATAAMTLGALVKYLSGPGLVWLTLASVARARTWPRRFVRVLMIALISIGLALVLAAPWLELPDSLDPLFEETGNVGYVNALPDTFLLMLVGHAPATLDRARGVERVVILIMFAAYLLWEARSVWLDPTRRGIARGLVRACLVYILVVSTSVQTWYFCLPVAVVVLFGVRSGLTQLCLAYAALALPALYLSYYLRDATPGWVFVGYAFGPLLVLLPMLTSHGRRFLVRSDVPVGLDHVALDPRSHADAQPAGALARDEPGGPERGPGPLRGVPQADE